ncbi:MAG: type II secretion system F family protein, partial [Eubacterium sp.]
LQQKVQTYVDSTDEYLMEVELPDKIGKEEVVFTNVTDNFHQYILIAAIVLSVAVYFLKDRDLNKKAKARDEEMLEDYPEIVSKLMLLNCAGLSITSAWERILQDYEKQTKKFKKRYAYEEMRQTQIKINSGVSLGKAYGDFGKRCKLHCYLKLSSLLQQSINRGNRGFSEALKQEAAEIFELRKNSAKKRGEEAGTKLLLPMIMMLIISMVIIIVPAFLSMEI